MSRTRLAVLVVAGVLVALFGGRWLALRYTEALWYADLGHGAQFRHLLIDRLLWQALVFVAASAWYGAQLFAVYFSIGAVQLPRRIGDLEIAEAVPRRVLRAIAFGGAALLGLLTTVTFHDLADYVSLYRAAVPFGLPEPVLGRDVSFYLARLPLVETVHLMAAIAVVVALLLSAGLYALTGSLVVRRRELAITPHARAHLVSVLAALALVVAWGFQVDAFQLVGGGGSADGALALADRVIRIPAATTLAIVGLAVAALTVLFLRWGSGAGLLAVWGAYAILAVGGRYVAPVVRQAWGGPADRSVALGLSDLVDRYSRAGMGVAGVRSEAAPEVRGTYPAGDPTLRAALVGLSPWSTDPSLLPAWLNAISSDSAAPRLWTVSTTGLTGPEGRPTLEAVAVSETDIVGLLRSRDRPSWTATHRGRLAWAGPVLVLDLTSDGAGRLDTAALAGPVRFLAHEAELAVLGEEGRRPGEPRMGVPLKGLVRRLLLAWALQAPPLLGNRTSAGDRVLYWRDVPQRLAHLYPFASFGSPRGVLAGGRLVWLAPGYLASGRFPLAEQVPWHDRQVNYLRVPYLATVDALTGDTRLYLRGQDSAFAARLAARSGAVPLPPDSIPAALSRQLGYAPSFFTAQAEALARHHGEPGQLAWAVGRGPSDDPSRPRPAPQALEVLLPLEGRWGLWRLLPLVDAGGNRLVGFVAGAESEAGPAVPRLLRLTSADFPTLAAAESRFNATPAVVSAVAAAAGPDGVVRRSPVLALPAGATVVYAQGIFASQHRLTVPPSVSAIALLADGRVGVGPDVGSAVGALRAAEAVSVEGARNDRALAAARAAFVALDSAARAGDWVAVGRALENLRRALGAPGARRP
jgi:uncharacterized membrane protein (UPF0182 family)